MGVAAHDVDAHACRGAGADVPHEHIPRVVPVVEDKIARERPKGDVATVFAQRRRRAAIVRATPSRIDANADRHRGDDRRRSFAERLEDVHDKHGHQPCHNSDPAPHSPSLDLSHPPKIAFIEHP